MSFLSVPIAKGKTNYDTIQESLEQNCKRKLAEETISTIKSEITYSFKNKRL
jgi:ADP-ribose pyrophosphatase YjhB (NUDIX family)